MTGPGRTADRIAAAVLLALAGLVFWQSTLWPQAIDVAGDPVVMPRGLALAMIAAAIALFFARPRSDASPDARPGRALVVVAITALFAVVLKPLGLIAASIPFLVVVQRITGASWRALLPAALATPVLVWIVFAVILKVPLPAGTVWAQFTR